MGWMASKLSLFIRLSRPLFLLGAVLLYGFGVGIARFLGTSIDWSLYLLGQGIVTTLQLSAHYLNEFYDAPSDVENNNRTSFSGGSGAIGPGKLTRNTALVAAATSLTLMTSLSVLLLEQVNFSPLIVIILILSFLGAFFYSTPPIR